MLISVYAIALSSKYVCVGNPTRLLIVCMRFSIPWLMCFFVPSLFHPERLRFINEVHGTVRTKAKVGYHCVRFFHRRFFIFYFFFFSPSNYHIFRVIVSCQRIANCYFLLMSLIYLDFIE